MTAISTPTTATFSVTTTPGDTVDITKPARFVSVTNTHASQLVYVTCRAGLLAAHLATLAAANADDVYTVAAGATVLVGTSSKALQWNLSLVGSGAATTGNVNSGLTQPVATFSNTVSGTIVATGVAGVAAVDAAVSGNPVQVAGRGSTATPTAMSADNDVTLPWLTLNGAHVISGGIAADAAVGTVVHPVGIGGVGSTAPPTAMSADGDVTRAWLDLNGAFNTIHREKVVSLTATPTITAGAYDALDALGGVMTFTAAALASGRPFKIVHATISDLSVQNALIWMFLFKVTPPSPAADNAAFSFSDANWATGVPFGVIDFVAANYRPTALQSICTGTVTANALGASPITANTSGSANFFAAMQTGTAATPTYAGTAALVVSLEIVML